MVTRRPSSSTTCPAAICGRGRNCGVVGDAVQREFGAVLNGTLELALYTFKYVDGVESLLFFMPSIPAPEEEADGAPAPGAAGKGARPAARVSLPYLQCQTAGSC